MGCQCHQKHSYREKRCHDRVRTKPLIVIDSYCAPVKSETRHEKKPKHDVSCNQNCCNRNCCCQRRCRRSWI